MDAANFDRLAATLGSGSDRRRAIAGLLAGTASLFGEFLGASGKARKKKCTYCPQRACCSCRSVKDGPPTTCFYIEGLSPSDSEDACFVSCGGGDYFYAVKTAVPKSANVCKADHTCGAKSCPIPV
jgi:hypothetical protein